MAGWPGPYTTLNVGDIAVRGYVTATAKFGGWLQAHGDFPAYESDGLLIGQLVFSSSGSFQPGDEILFDIVAGRYAAYATNVRKV